MGIWGKVETDAARLMAAARAETGIDIVDHDIAEPLARLIGSLNSEAELSAEGAAGMETRLKRLLSNRLRMQRDLIAHPEILDQPIVRPLFLSGAPRTGSTKLHKMLAASGDFQFLPFWRGYSLSLRTGSRDEDPGARRGDAEDFVRWFDERAPEAKLIHAYSATEAEEETLLFEHALAGGYLMALAYVPTFAGWSVPKQRAALPFLKQTLQYLQWQFHDGSAKPWVLKTPMHLGGESALAEIFPDAVFVGTHRDPQVMVPSSASLITQYHKAVSDATREAQLGPMILAGLAAGTDQMIADRAAHPDMPVLDVSYSALTQSSHAVVEQVYAHHGTALSATAAANIAAWERDNAQHKFGAHRYSLEEFGLTAGEIGQSFSRYISRFSPYF